MKTDAELLREELEYEAAEAVAWVELGGASAPKITPLDTATGLAYLAEKPLGNGACLVAAVWEGEAVTGKVLAAYTHAVTELGEGGPDDNPYHTSEALALERARQLSLKHRSRVYEVWPLERGDRVALVYDGVVYRA